MSKVRTTLTIDDGVLRAVRVRAARTGVGDSQVIEAALRRDLGLDLLDRIWSGDPMDEDAAMRLALEAQGAARNT
jgi:plasmid stability protein